MVIFNHAKLLRKTQKLLNELRISQLNDRLFSVDGDHGFWLVKQNDGGVLSCSCPNFERLGICSHVVAVAIFLERTLAFVFY